MSDNILKVTVREEINLNGDSYDALNINEIGSINEISKRIVTIPTGSEINLINFSSSIGSGQFINSDVKYLRFTNLGSTESEEDTIHVTFKNFVNPANTSSKAEFAVRIPKGQTFMYNGTNTGVSGSSFAASGSALSSSLDTVFTSLEAIHAITSGSAGCDLEYFVASL